MRIIRFLLTAVLFSLSLVLHAQIDRALKLIEGLVIFNPLEMEGGAIENMIFIPYTLDITKSIQENTKNCLESKKVGYFMYFRNMRHTQPFIRMKLTQLNAFDSTRYTIKTSLRQSCASMEIDSILVTDFPNEIAGQTSCGQMKVSGGGIIFDESLIEAYKKDKDLSYSESLVPCQIDIDSKKVELKYHQYYYNQLVFGMSLSFLPIVLNK